MAVSKRLRYEVLRRDNHTCRYCGGVAPDVKMTVDHVTPVSLGGSDDPANLVAACADCNAGKSSSPPTSNVVADVAQSTLRWAQAMQVAADREAETLAKDTAVRAELAEEVECRWTSMWLDDPSANDTSTRYRHPGRRYAPRPVDWVESIERMIAAGLAIDDIHRAIHKAMHKSNLAWDEVWRYFCGIAWSTLRERQDAARAILEAGDA